MEDLFARIRLDRDATLELKPVFLSGNKVIGPRRGDFADELASMANAQGGTAVLGVDSRIREVRGISLDRLDDVETWVCAICNDAVDPPLDAVIRKLELPDADGQPRAVIRVDVPRSLFVHKSPGGYWRRLGRSKREMSSEQLARLFQEKSQSRGIRFDEIAVPGTSPDDLDMALTRRFLRPGSEFSLDMLRKLRVIVDDDGSPGITVAGVLLCTEGPGQWLPHAHIQAVSYVGERQDVNYQVDAQDFAGPLDIQVLDALRFVRRNMRVRAQFSTWAVFEALVNAVAHRDYSMHGAHVRLRMFRDRLELYVPGALAGTLTPDSLHLRQSSRNELIVSLLTRCRVEEEDLNLSHMMARRGDGVPTILEESLALAGTRPAYTLIDDSELRLVIWAAGSDF